MRIPSRPRTLYLLFVTSLFAAHATARMAGPDLPPGFIAQPIGSGWVVPTGIVFLDQTRLLVAEKSGRIWYVENDVQKNLVLDLRAETLNNGDRGVLGIALDPAFEANGLLYLLLVVDPDQDESDLEQETFSRLVRYRTSFDSSGNLVADDASRFELLGATWPTGIPSCHLSHAVGTIRFLSDGSLVLSHGDGAHYDLTDAGGYDADCFGAGKFSADQDIGSFRSVYEGSLSGKILRIDPATGLGLADNPFFDGDPSSIRSRIWASGLRNPFRFTTQPGSGPKEVLFISDVGWNSWEEVNVARGGENFGWPCYEGPYEQDSYQSADPQGFCAAMASSHAAPLLAWHHSDPTYAGYTGNCAAGIAFYTGGSYPPIYHDVLFYTDYTRGWLRMAHLDENLQVTGVSTFGTGLGLPVDLVTQPGTGDLVFVSVGATDSIYRIRYVGQNAPPIAVATADPAWGGAPLSVQLTGSQSSDPDQDSILFHWDLGDGTSSELADLVHVYPDPTINYRPRLRVTDAMGYETWAELLITPGNTPPSIDVLVSPADGDLYTVGQPVAFSAFVSDIEDDAAGTPPTVLWHVDLFHDHHHHPDYAVMEGESSSFLPDVPYDGTFFRVRLEVRDSRGLGVEEPLMIYDANSGPKAHIVGASDDSPRLGQSVQLTGHMELPGNVTHGEVPALTWEWGDGSRQTFTGLGHQEDSTPSHLYERAGAYTVQLVAQLGTELTTAQTTIHVGPKLPAVAVFLPLIIERYIPWTEQQAIADELVAIAHASHREAEVFLWHEQAELVQWMSEYLDDGVNDAVVILDLAPSSIHAGENEGSLAERWMESGNTIVWSGQTPFYEYVFEDATTSIENAAWHGADDVLDPLLPMILAGGGFQNLKAPASSLPSLEPFHAIRALRMERVGLEWRREIVYAHDNDIDSDAIALRHRSGGVYAQFLCTNASVPRRQVLAEFLRTYVLRPRLDRKH